MIRPPIALVATAACAAMLGGVLPGTLQAQVPASPAAPAPGASATPPPPAPSTAPVASPAPQPPAIPAPPVRVFNPAELSRRTPLAEAPNWSRLADLSKTMTAEEFDLAWNTFFSDGRNEPPPWKRDAAGITVPTGTSDGSTVRVEFRTAGDPISQPKRNWRMASELPPLQGKPVLTGLRIALDPGHIGGSFAKVEERFFTMNPKDPTEFIAEGDHVLTVAQMLKPRLEALGAIVSLVRDKPEPVTSQRPADLRSTAIDILHQNGHTNPPESYVGVPAFQKMNTIQWESEKLFYRVSEIRARAQKVNTELKPDLVICMHLNAAPWGEAGEQVFSPENHLHLLVNGCYAPEELRMQDTRFEMLHRLFSRMHEEELPIATAVAKSMSQSTGLPPFVYVTPNARLVSETGYVYARNLLANRLYECPVIYLEPFVMNNEEVYRRLLQGPYTGRTLTNGRLRSSIYEDYAQGIIDGLVNYYRSKRK